MGNRSVTRAEFFSLLPIATGLVRKRPLRGGAEKLAASFEANKSGYERAQSGPDQGGVAKEVGAQMMSAAAKAAERRRKK